jgi:ABC-2 type transport system ATP-binding protein
VVLSARGLSKRYRTDRPWALRDVTLDIRAGSLTAIVGPNGAGKSTLIRTWMGFERPTLGSASVMGCDPWTDRERALASLGYVPQGTSLYRSLTVDDHVELAAALRDPFDADLVRARLQQLGIEPRQQALELSGGQQAQLCLAIALGTRAPVLLLDEPLASLDPLARRELMLMLVGVIREEGRTAVMSSHVVTDVEGACDRMIILSDGHVRSTWRSRTC